MVSPAASSEDGLLGRGAEALRRVDRPRGHLGLLGAVDALFDDLWERTGAALASRGVAVRRPRSRLTPWRAQRFVLRTRELRAQVVETVRHDVLTVGPWSRRTDRLTTVLWAADVVEHGLSPRAMTDHDMVDAVAARMSPGDLADRLARPVSMLQGYVLVPQAGVAGG